MSIDPSLFRETLGHYPTGVALVTAVVDGSPLGMVVGSFTSVSLDPPLVAYLPMRTSYTYSQLLKADSFCVNVLAADQLDTCRVFASRAESKFDGVGWHPAPSGAPILDDAVSWVDCTPESTHDGGDHDIVVGRVTALGVQRPVLPLLFFQGGYGQFAPMSLVAASGPDALAGARLSGEVRADLERLARDENVDIAVLARSGNFATFVATVNGSSQPGRTSVGMRVPLVPPLGSVFYMSSDEQIEGWIDTLPKATEEERTQYRSLARTVAQRGYSLSFSDGGTDEVIWELAQKLADRTLTPSEERRLTSKLTSTIPEYEQNIEDNAQYDLRAIIVPIPEKDGRVPMALRLSASTGPTEGLTIKRWAARLLQLADEVGRKLDVVSSE